MGGDEDPGDEVQDEKKTGEMIYSRNIAAAWKLMQMGLELKDEVVEFVSPDLWKAYMECKAGPEDGDEAFVAEFMEAQVKRVDLLKKKFLMKKVVLMPVHCSNHWTLVVVDGRASGEPRLLYMDSLRSEGMVKQVWSDTKKALEELLGWSLPERWNEARQPTGSLVCGAYVLHYMEQSCRALLLQEPWSSLGWPSFEAWGERVWKLAGMLKKEQGKLKGELEKEEEKQKKKQEADAKKAAKTTKAEAVDAALEALADEADAGLKKIPPGKPCLENLSLKAQEAVAIAALGAGICSKCRWSHGCKDCDGEKALRYWLHKEGLLVETMEMKTISKST